MILLTVATHSQNLYPYLCERRTVWIRTPHPGMGRRLHEPHAKGRPGAPRVERGSRTRNSCALSTASTPCSAPRLRELRRRIGASRVTKKLILVSVDGAPRDMRVMRYPVWAYSYWRTFGSLGTQGCYLNTGMFLGPAREPRPVAPPRADPMRRRRGATSSRGRAASPRPRLRSRPRGGRGRGLATLLQLFRPLCRRWRHREATEWPRRAARPATEPARGLPPSLSRRDTLAHADARRWPGRAAPDARKWGWLAKGKVYLRGFALEIGVAGILLGLLWYGRAS